LQKQEDKEWYGEIITLGERTDWRYLPSQLYLDVLKKGLKEPTGCADEEIDKYWEKFLK